MSIAIYVIEDHEIFSIAYRSVFSEGKDYRLVGMAESLHHAALAKALSSQKTDLLLIGIKLLTPQVVEEIKRIRQGFPGLGIVLTFVACEGAVIKTLNSLATGNRAGIAVFLKQSLRQLDQLLRMMASVREGYFILDPSLTGPLLNEKSRDSFLKELTRRELEILNLIAEGHSNSAIAGILYIDIKTVRHHINNIYSKLKSEEDFNLKHPRVHATRRYLATKGELVDDGDRSAFRDT